MGKYHRDIREKRPSSAEVHETFRRTNVGTSIDGLETRTGEVEQQLAYSPPVGSLIPYVGEVDPPGGKWLVADGRTIPIESYPDYAAVAGTAFNTGGEPAGHVRLPNTKGRGVIGAGTGTGLTDRVRGTIGGTQTHVLDEGEMPSHSHGGATGNQIHSHNADSHNHTLGINHFGMSGSFGGGRNVFTPDSWDGDISRTTSLADPNIHDNTHNHSIGSNGLDLPHNNMPPWIAMPHIVRVLL